MDNHREYVDSPDPHIPTFPTDFMRLCATLHKNQIVACLRAHYRMYGTHINAIIAVCHLKV